MSYINTEDQILTNLGHINLKDGYIIQDETSIFNHKVLYRSYRRSTMSDHRFPNFTIFSSVSVSLLCIWCKIWIYDLLKIQINRLIDISIITRTNT